MSFSVLEWLFSKSLDLTVTKSSAVLNNLQIRLNKTVDEWAKKLPVTDSLISVAMYLDIHSNNNNDTRLKTVGSQLESGKLPTLKMLSDALYEKWLECKANDADQPFFLVGQARAKVYIKSLASVILAVLVQEKALFNDFVHEQLTHLRTENKRIHSTLEVLEGLVRKNEELIKPTKKIFRPIPDCRIPIFNDQEERTAMLATLLKISLFKAFSQTKYHKFTCLMIHSHDAFYKGKNDLPGLTLYTGEIDFLSDLRNLVDLFLHDLELFKTTINSYYNNLEFSKFKLKMGLRCHEGLYAYECEIDGSAYRYSILQTASMNEIDYDHMSSLNSALLLMPTMTVPSFFLIEFEKLFKSPPMTKFIYCCMLENKVDFGRLRINVNDFDDWDFEYVLKSNY